MLHALFLTTWASMVEVPLWAWWLGVLGPMLLMTAICLMGLPGAKARRKTKPFRLSKASHGMSMETREVKEYDDWYTEANAITAVGLVVLVASGFLIALKTCLVLVPFMFLVVVFSDLFDGFTATVRDCHSVIGIWLDPLRDRLTVPVILLSIACTLGVGWWILPAVCIAVFEHKIYQAGMEVSRRYDAKLNTHGPGMRRQIVHLLMVELILVVFYLVPLPVGYTALVVDLALVFMAIASYYAMTNYIQQFESFKASNECTTQHDVAYELRTE